MLTRKGFAVTAVGSLAEARAIAGELKPGHAVVDMRLEDGNGLDLVAELRALSPDVRIVMLTGYGNLATAVAAVKAGAVDYLAKPADPEDIVRALVRRRQQPPGSAAGTDVGRPGALGTHPAGL